MTEQLLQRGLPSARLCLLASAQEHADSWEKQLTASWSCPNAEFSILGTYVKQGDEATSQRISLWDMQLFAEELTYFHPGTWGINAPAVKWALIDYELENGEWIVQVRLT